MGDAPITYESLFEILRVEKNREEIQKLSPDFSDEVKIFLREEERQIDQAGSEDEKNRLRTELHNTKNIIRELYNRREKKILFLALNRARTPSIIIDRDALLASEEEFFDKVTHLLERNREQLFSGLFYNGTPQSKPSPTSEEMQEQPTRPSEHEQRSQEAPEEKEKDQEPSSQEGSSLSEETSQGETAENESDGVTAPETRESEESVNEEESKNNINEAKNEAVEEPQTGSSITIRFTHPVPKFVGRNLEVYGPFEKGDEATLPPEVGEILIEKERAIRQ